VKGGRTGTAEDRGARSDGAESGGLGERTRASGDGDCGRARADGRAESVSLSLWLVCPKQTRSWSRVALGRTTNEAMRGGQRTGAGRGGERRRELLVGGEAEGLAGGKHGWRLGCWCWTGTEARRVLLRGERAKAFPTTTHRSRSLNLALLPARHPRTPRHFHHTPPDAPTPPRAALPHPPSTSTRLISRGISSQQHRSRGRMPCALYISYTLCLLAPPSLRARLHPR